MAKHKIDASIGRQMEKDVLRAIADHGGVSPRSEATKTLLEKYPDEDHSDGHMGLFKVTDMLDGLVDDRLLRPAMDQDGKTLRAASNGLTPKGWERLYELEHPIKYWMQKQWFPFSRGLDRVSSIHHQYCYRFPEVASGNVEMPVFLLPSIKGRSVCSGCSS